MNNVIANLWNGNIIPIKNFQNNNPEIKNITNLIERNREKLNKTLNEEQAEMFEKYICCIDEYLALIAEQAFCNGFGLGGKLSIEIFMTNRYQAEL